MRVSARRIAVGAALIGGLYLVAVFTLRGVPDRAMAWFGGPSSLELRGGLVLRYRPPEGADLTRFLRATHRPGTVVRRDGSVLHVEIPGLSEAEAAHTASLATHGGLEFREALEDLSIANVPIGFRSGDDQYVLPGVRLEVDSWPTDSGERNTAYYLEAESPEDLTRAFEQLRDAGWVQPPRSIIGFERRDPDEYNRSVRWRSYVLGEVLLDADAVANATRSTDPYTGRPIVLLDFTEAGGERFARISEQVAGHKLAMMLGGQVQSAPIINGPITGGRASITMGGGNVLEQERQAEAMVAVVATVPLPPGGVIEDQRWVAPAAASTRRVLWTLAIGMLGGGGIGLVACIVVGFTRPRWRPRIRRGAGGQPGRRIAVTLLAPVALILLGQLPWPGLNVAELEHIMAAGGRSGPLLFTIADFGVRPIIAAFILVELVSLIWPRWRRSRLQPEARRRRGSYVAALGIAIAVLQGYFAVRYVDALQGGDVELLAPDLATHVAVIGSLVVGTMLLSVVAGIIREHGLGNGYGALLVSEWVIGVAFRIIDGPNAGHALGLVTLAVIGAATAAVLRMQVGHEREAPLRVPSSGIIPFSGIGALIAVWSLIRTALSPAGPSVASISAPVWIALGALVVLVPLWSFAFSRPAVVAPLAAHTELAPPAQASWRRATLLSWVSLLFIVAASLLAAATHADAEMVCEATIAMTFTAVLLDIVDDLRAQRADLVAIWPLHQAQHAELVQRVLSGEGIECHLRSSHLRTLLGFFGPHVPIDVLVPAASVDAARERISALYREAPLNGVFD